MTQELSKGCDVQASPCRFPLPFSGCETPHNPTRGSLGLNPKVSGPGSPQNRTNCGHSLPPSLPTRETPPISFYINLSGAWVLLELRFLGGRCCRLEGALGICGDDLVTVILGAHLAFYEQRGKVWGSVRERPTHFPMSRTILNWFTRYSQWQSIINKPV